MLRNIHLVSLWYLSLCLALPPLGGDHERRLCDVTATDRAGRLKLTVLIHPVPALRLRLCLFRQSVCHSCSSDGTCTHFRTSVKVPSLRMCRNLNISYDQKEKKKLFKKSPEQEECIFDPCVLLFRIFTSVAQKYKLQLFLLFSSVRLITKIHFETSIV